MKIASNRAVKRREVETLEGQMARLSVLCSKTPLYMPTVPETPSLCSRSPTARLSCSRAPGDQHEYQGRIGWKHWTRTCDALGDCIWRPDAASFDAFGIKRETFLLLNTFLLLFEWMVPKDKTARQA